MGLGCVTNRLTAPDISNNKELEFLNCFDNKLAELDVSNNPKLSFLGCTPMNTLSSLYLAQGQIIRTIITPTHTVLIYK